MKRFFLLIPLTLAILIGMAFAFVPQSWIQVSVGALAAVFYQTVDQSGTPLTQRPTLNFTGAGVSCVDNSGATRTDCTISGGGGGGDTFTPPYVTPDSSNFYEPLFKITKIVNASYTWLNQGSATLTVESSGVINMSVPGDNTLHGRYIASYPSTPFAIEYHAFVAIPAGGATAETGLFFTDGTKLVVWSSLWSSNNVYLDQSNWSNASTFTGGIYQQLATWATLQGSGLHLVACDDGTTNFTFGHSPDGIHWIKDDTVGRTAFLTPSGVGFLGYQASGGPATLAADNWTQTTCPF